jgi:hypothetical protein
VYPSDHMLAAWGGTLPSGEEFAGAMKFASPNDIGMNTQVSLVDNDNACDDVLADLTAFWQTPTAYIPRYAVLTWFKWNRIGTNGRYVNDTTRIRENLSIAGGSNPTTANPPLPHQVAWTTTYLTNAQRGLANKGRTYWPTNVQLNSSTLLVEATSANYMAQNVSELIRAWGDWPGLDVTGVVPVVGSIGEGSRPGQYRSIRSISVGNRLDIQRRRAEKVTEERYGAAVAGF